MGPYLGGRCGAGCGRLATPHHALDYDARVPRLVRFACEGAVGRALVAAVLLLALGCDESRPVRAKPTTAAAGRPRPALVGAGVEPREPLRYALTVGTSQRIALTLHLAMRVEAARSPIPPVTAPGLRLTVELAVTDATPGGGARCQVTIADADLADLDRAAPELVAEMRKGVGLLIGAKGGLTIEPSGLVSDFALALPSGLGDELGQFATAMRAALEHLSTPLPREAVGVGASWEVAEEIADGGIKVRQKTLFELVAHDGSRAKLRMQYSHAADRQTAPLPGLPPGVTTEIIAYDSSGGGVLEIDLSRPAPVSQRADMTTGVSFRLLKGAEAQTMSLSSDSRLELDGL
jgi:hypothetical protein